MSDVLRAPHVMEYTYTRSVGPVIDRFFDALVPSIAPAPPLTPVAEAPAPPRQTVSAGPVAADAGDGSEAVDWLLRNSRRR